VLFDAENEDTGEELGAVYVRNPNVVVALTPSKWIEYRRLDELEPHHEYPGGVTPDDAVVRACRRAGYAGSFPVVRTDGTILNGHKRVRAAEAAGLEHHPVEVIDVTDEQARELFAIAHRELAVDAEPDALDHLVFVFTGELSRDRETVTTVVENHGAKIAHEVTDETDYVVAGDDAGEYTETARLQGTPVLDERALSALLNEHGVEYPP
jgi:NAD-dependent DNA ligase